MGPAAAGWPILHALRKYTFFTHSVSYPEIGWPSAGTGLHVELLHAAIMGTNRSKVLRFRDQRAASASWPSDQTRACGDPPTLSLRFSAVTTTSVAYLDGGWHWSAGPCCRSGPRLGGRRWAKPLTGSKIWCCTQGINAAACDRTRFMVLRPAGRSPRGGT